MEINDIVVGEVCKSDGRNFLVKLKNEDTFGFIHVSNISDFFVPNIWTYFQKGESYHFQIIDLKPNFINLSWKSISPNCRRNPFKFQIKKIDGSFDNLFKKVQSEINKWSN